MTKRSAKPDARTLAAGPGSGMAKVSVLRKRVPRLPHERDESADPRGSAPDARMRQASADLARGLQDTDRSAEMDRLRRQLKVRR